MLSYTDLQTYRKCPRLFVFHRLGYQPPMLPQAMTIGSFVHSGLSAYFRGQNITQILVEVETEAICRLKVIQDRLARNAALDETMAAAKQALALLTRYVAYWGKGYLAPLVEPELMLGSVVCHPDLIAHYQDKRVIVDFKTGHSPDVRWYDISGQLDLYAYVYSASLPANPPPISLVIYDTIAEEGLYRHERPPRLEAGERLFKAIELLVSAVPSVGGLASVYQLLDNPHPVFDCPNRCQFFTPCWLLDTDSWEACEDYLNKNYIQKEDKDDEAK